MTSLAAYLERGFTLAQGYYPHPITGEPQYFADGKEIDQAEAIAWYEANGLPITTSYEAFDDDHMVLWKLRFC